MRRTGKLYSLTLISTSLGIVASVSVSLWNFNTSELHLWLDLTPQGFGISSMITTTLIVSFRAILVNPPETCFLTPPMLVGYDFERGKGGYSRRHGHHLSFPDDWSSTWGHVERGTCSEHPYKTASQAHHSTWGCRGLIHLLSNIPPVHLTLEPYCCRSLNRFATAPQSYRNCQPTSGWPQSTHTLTL